MSSLATKILSLSATTLFVLPAIATPFPIQIQPEQIKGQNIVVREYGAAGDVVFVTWTNDGNPIVARQPGGNQPYGQHGTLTHNENLPEGKGRVDFTTGKNIVTPEGEVTVTDYSQTTNTQNDPGTLYAAAFSNGVMEPSLFDWLNHNGYGSGNEIFQPDFYPVGFTDIYYGVDLAALRDAGQTFVNSYSFGDTFTLVNGRISELPMYYFSSTPLTYVQGSGWVGTPESGEVQYAAFHATTTDAVPEPSTILMCATGLTTVVLAQFSKGRRVHS
jgi:hypothetical protein